jgi:threonine dehydrogenase-like Zn-dependent dehydrogenase
LRVDGRQLAAGMTIGYHRDLPGGWGDEILAHESQIFPVDDALDDRVGVLIEPLSVSVHALLHARLSASARVLVIGSGPIGLGSIWALRALGHKGLITAQVKRASEAELARAFGADDSVTPKAQAREALRSTGARSYRPSIGPDVWRGGGYDVVIECVGRAESLHQALRSVTSGGLIVVLGCTGQLRSLDLTPLWAHEVTIAGFVGYGAEQWLDRNLHTFEVTHELLKATRAPLSEMVQVVPLSDYGRALRLAAHRSESGAVKVALCPTASAGGAE